MCLNSNCTVQPEYSNSNSSDPAAGVGSHETGGDASPQFIAVMTLAAILLLIGFIAKLRMKETMNVDADADADTGKTGGVAIAPLPLLTSAQLDFLPAPGSTAYARHAPAKAASSRLSRRLSTIIDITLTRPLRHISMIIRDPWGFIRDSCRARTGIFGTTGALYKPDGYAPKGKFVEESMAETGTLGLLSVTSLTMSAHGLELGDVGMGTEFESQSRFQAQSHALPPAVHVGPCLERTRDVRSWRVLEVGGLRTTV